MDPVVGQRSRSQPGAGADNYNDFRSVSTINEERMSGELQRAQNPPSRWHPEYVMRGTPMSLPNYAYQPHFDPVADVPSDLMSPIPEDTSSLHYSHRDVGYDLHPKRQLVTNFPEADFRSRRFLANGYSENGFLHNPTPASNPPRVPIAENESTRVPSTGTFVKKKREAKNPGARRSFRSSTGAGGHPAQKDDSPSHSSEDYGSSFNLPESGRRRGQQAARSHDEGRRPLREETHSSATDSDSVEWRGGASGRNIDRRNGHIARPNRLQRPEIRVHRTSMPESSEQDSEDFHFQAERREKRSLERSRSPGALKSQAKEVVVVEEEEERWKPQSTGMSRSQRPLSSSLNSLQVPGYGTTPGSSTQRSGLESSRSSSRSEAAQSSRTSRQQSVFRLGGPTVSAQMVSSNPSAAADAAFASLELPPGFLPTSSKQLRHMCKPLMTCLLLMMLAASLSAAVYFAVVLNKTQGKHIEFLRARLNFYLNQTSSDLLTSMSASERYRFESEYCKEINGYYQTSELSSTYRGCEIASVQPDKLSVLLYFDKPARNKGSNSSSNQTMEDAILKVLASSAPRVTQKQEGDVISVNNLPLRLSTVDISVEQTTQSPRFSALNQRNPQSSLGTGETESTDTQPDPKEQDLQHATTTKRAPTIYPNPDPFHPCSEGGSKTYYRYPGSCAMFFQCLNGHSIALSCGPHLVFDLDRKVCIQEVADCDEESQEAEFSDVDPEELQPCEYKGGSYHPHPRICNLFFQCSTVGASVVSICPHGLVFSAQLQTCALLGSSPCPEVPATTQNTGSSQSAPEQREKGSEPKAREPDIALSPAQQADFVDTTEHTVKAAEGTDSEDSTKSANSVSRTEPMNTPEDTDTDESKEVG